MKRSSFLMLGAFIALSVLDLGAASTANPALEEAIKRSNQQIVQRDFLGALETLVPFKQDRLQNAKVAYNLGSAWLGLDRPVTARREYTLALTIAPQHSYAHLGRALAESFWGDTERVERDYQRAVALYPEATTMRKEIDEHLAAAKVTVAPAQLLAELEKAVAQNEPEEKLLERGLNLQRAMATQRKRYDDWYQVNLAERDKAVRDNPKSAAALVALGQFIYQESRVEFRSESVEPRRGRVLYRDSADEAAELDNAMQQANRALALEPQNIPAMVLQAEIYERRLNSNASQAVVTKILAREPGEPTANRLRAEYHFRQSIDRALAAERLRMPQTKFDSHIQYENGATYLVTKTTVVAASEASLRQADQHDRQADALTERGSREMAGAIKALKGSVEGQLMTAALALDSGEVQPAFVALVAAVKQAPQSTKVHEAISEYYRRTGASPDLATLERSLAANLLETTAGWRLKGVWEAAAAKQWDRAERLLAEARTLDPVDARSPAYLAVVREAQGRLPEAQTLYRTALALENARLRLDDRAGRTTAPPARPVLDYGLSLALREKLGGLAERANDSTRAQAYYQANLAIARLMSDEDRRQPLYTAMLPGQLASRFDVPMPPRADELLAKTHQHLGEIAQREGRIAEARDHLAAANDFRKRAKQAEDEALYKEMGVSGTRPGATTGGRR